MHFFRMEGPWNRWMARLYEAVVASGICYLYDTLVKALFSGMPGGCRLLDLGCGSGQVAIRIAEENPQARVFGLDLSRAQVVRASLRGRGLPNVGFGVGDALWLPFPDESFDIVVSIASIKHWPYRRRGLEQIRRVSKRGGLAYVIEVEKNGSKQDVQRFVDRWRLVLPGTRPFLYGYFRRFVAGQGLREEEMVTLFRDAGFSSVYVQKIPSEPFLIGLGIK